ncbi:MAG: acetoacetate metabolism regulatory protein AtoC [Bacteroidia bacterium]|nr:MAG: acetoacetate metabolism regulatory protein AtoC [Bacteroidia bacterium]
MKPHYRILVVDDEPASRLNIKDILADKRFLTDEAEDGRRALQRISENPYDLVLLDIRMPKMDGLTALKEIVKKKPDLPVLVFTAYGSSAKAIEAMKLGAFDYITKPFDIDELLETVKRAVRHKELTEEVSALRGRLAGIEGLDFQPEQLISKSPAMQNVFKMIGKVARSDATVLLQGETGTGKELVANALWHHSTRRSAPFIKVNCAAIPDGLMESELFGHERGAFTGAELQRKGRFELADKGTLFLDEVAEMSPALQSKFLRVLEQGEFHRVGGKDTIQVDVRVIAATNKNLEAEVREGRFRRDLYFRLQVMQIEIPPLRERKEDIPLLVDHFLKKYGGKRTLYATKEVYQQLKDYPWPGNVRELENVIQRATVLAQGKYVTPEHIALAPMMSGIQVPIPTTSSPYALREILAKVEREVILKALEVSKWNRTKTAALLKIDRRVLFSKIKEYGLKK